MTRIVLLISFIILLGRLLYAAIGALEYQRSQQHPAVEQLTPAPPFSGDSERRH